MTVAAGQVPLAVLEAIERGAAAPLPDRSGWAVFTEVTRAPCCGQMVALFIARQTMPDLKLDIRCHHCAPLKGADECLSNPSR